VAVRTERRAAPSMVPRHLQRERGFLNGERLCGGAAGGGVAA